MESKFERCKRCGWGGYVECSICNTLFYLTKKQVQDITNPICKECKELQINATGKLNLGWERVRSKIIERDDNKCVKCGDIKDLQVHHIDKNNRNNNSDNLITLCKKCHYLEHKEDPYKHLLE